jgi:hypothetical protein
MARLKPCPTRQLRSTKATFAMTIELYPNSLYSDRIFVRFGFRGCGKIPNLSFRGPCLPEESAFFLEPVKKQIPRCARDDKIADYFSSLFSRAVKQAKNIRL